MGFFLKPDCPGPRAELERNGSGVKAESRGGSEYPSTPLGVTSLVRLSGVEAFLSKVKSRQKTRRSREVARKTPKHCTPA
jgi:hypothetical protein